MSSTNSYLCPLCDRNVPVGKNCLCSKPKRKKRKSKAPPKSREQKDGRERPGLPDDNFDYDDFIAREFGTGKPHKQVGISPLWWITALILSAMWLILVLW